MTNIYNLTEIDNLTGGDNFEVFDLSNGNSRKCSLSSIQAFMQANLTFNSASDTTQAFSPATGGDVQVTSGIGNVYLRLTPLATLANLEISLPTLPDDKQEVLVKCTQIVTTLVVSSTDTVLGAPVTLTANGSFKMRYEANGSTWDLVA